MIEQEINPLQIIPIDLGCYHEYEKLCDKKEVEPSVVIENPYDPERYFIIDGTHHAASRLYRKENVRVKIIENDQDIEFLRENVHLLKYTRPTNNELIKTTKQLIGYCIEKNKGKYPMEQQTNLYDWLKLSRTF